MLKGSCVLELLCIEIGVQLSLKCARAPEERAELFLTTDSAKLI